MALDSIISRTIENIGHLLNEKAADQERKAAALSQMEALRSSLEALQSSLKNADDDGDDREGEEVVRNWTSSSRTSFPTMKELRDVVYDAEDIVDLLVSEAASSSRRMQNPFQRLLLPFGNKNLKESSQVAFKISAIARNISVLAAQMSQLQQQQQQQQQEGGLTVLDTKEMSRSSIRPALRRACSLAPQEDVGTVGLDEPAKKLVQQLVSTDDDDVGEELRQASVWSIVGMGGSGKTTLARMVYNHHLVEQHFDYRAWVCLSPSQQEFDTRSVLLQILKKHGGVDSSEDDVEDLVGKTRGFLSEKSYLVVLDDICTVEAWNDLRRAFPRGEGHRGKVLFITRNLEIPLRADKNCFIYKLPPLTESEAWSLLIRIVGWPEVAYNGDNNDLVAVGGDLLQGCRGNPLAILLLGGLLRTTNGLMEWQSIRHTLQEGHEFALFTLLELSYQFLPYDLKLCFLYLGIFPANCEIPTGTLIRLWLAEGLLSSKIHSRDMEYVAEEYLEQLIQHYMVEVTRINHAGKVKKVRLHGLIRDFCLKKAKEQDFLEILSPPYLPGSEAMGIKTRRAAIHSSVGFPFPEQESNIRSLLLFGQASFGDELHRKRFLDQIDLNSVCDNFMLLRILKLVDVHVLHDTLPKQIGDLVMLRYLELRSTNIKVFPHSIGNLEKLETFIWRHVVGGWPRGGLRLPDVIWKMEPLKHLFLPGGDVQYLPRHGENSNERLKLSTLKNLQTLWGVTATTWMVKDMEKLRNIRKLMIKEIETVEQLEAILRCKSIKLDRIYRLHLEWGLIEEWENIMSSQQSSSNYLSHQISASNYLPQLRPASYNLWKKSSISGYLSKISYASEYFSQYLWTKKRAGDYDFREKPLASKLPPREPRSHLRTSELSKKSPAFSDFPKKDLASDESDPNFMLLSLGPISHCKRLSRLFLSGRLGELSLHHVPCNVTELCLSRSRLWQDPMLVLGKLLNLKKLTLSKDAYIGTVISCIAGAFPQLEHLEFSHLRTIEEWIVKNGSMPQLKYIFIGWCPRLSKIPRGLGHNTNLKRLEVTHLSENFRRFQPKEGIGSRGEIFYISGSSIFSLYSTEAVAATKIQRLFRSWKKRNDVMRMGAQWAVATNAENQFHGQKKRTEPLKIEEAIVKIQAHVRGYLERKNFERIIWAVRTLEKVFLRWNRHGGRGLRRFELDGPFKDFNPQHMALDSGEDVDEDYLLCEQGMKGFETQKQPTEAVAATRIQRLFRGWKKRNDVVAQWTVATKAENQFHGQKKRTEPPREKAIVKIQQKVVIKVNMNNTKSRSKVLEIAASVSDVESVAIVGQDESQMEVTGDGVDAVELTNLLRKKVGYAELVSVSSVGKKKEEKDGSQSNTTLLETDSEIANIQEVLMQSGTLYPLRQSDGPSETSPETRDQNQQILMQGGMALTKAPECHEWERYTEIYLMENEFSELPENLRCLVLEALFLSRNSRLRMIPQSFFNNMPVLQILNISRTRIKSLPKSLFKLINLRRLFLNHCELLMRLPPEIGQLRNLEILDLEGTRITNLPREVEQLTNLTCLELSFNEPVNHRKLGQLYEVIPVGVLAALRQLEELNIDVSTVDKRWNACVGAVLSEVCGLTTLNTLKIYLPQVELLSRFNWYGAKIGSSSLSYFRLTVGHHIKRVMSRIPEDIEMEMDQYDKCLKYINGAGVPEEIKMVLGYTNAFFLDRHTDMKTLSEFGCENLMQLRWCVVGECNELETIIHGDQMGIGSSNEKNVGITMLEYLHVYYMKNLRCIWEGPICSNSFISLKKLTLRTCPHLTIIFTIELLASFSNLEELVVDDCPVITSLLSCYNSGHESTSFLPKLKKISLHYLPKLASISSGLSMSPTLEWMSFYNCPNLLCLPISKGCHTSLKKIMGEKSWWNALHWESNQQHSWDDTFVPIEDCD